MSRHERFEELCALAAAGEISAADCQELKAHLEECAACRGVFADSKEIHYHWLPEHPGFEIERNPASEARLRRSILKRAAAEGAEFSNEAAQSGPHPVAVAPRPRLWGFLHPSLSLAAGILIGVIGLGMVARMISRLPDREPHTAKTPTPAVQSSIPAIVHAQDTGVDARAAQEKLELALRKSQAEAARLEQQLKKAETRASELGQIDSAANLETADLRRQLESVRGSEVETRRELAKVRASQSDRDAQLVLVREENRELRDKLNGQTASLDRERELMSAGREIRDLIAARNLHIIDVYDTNGKGKTQRSFGRIFYTEGKSLVFYAYDLPPRRLDNAKYAYYAWGKKDASEVKIRNLGIFFNDDQSQKRWVFKFNDPQVLSEIDSVFVTLEKTDNPASQPSGKKLLSAYLGTQANHP